MHHPMWTNTLPSSASHLSSSLSANERIESRSSAPTRAADQGYEASHEVWSHHGQIVTRTILQIKQSIQQK